MTTAIPDLSGLRFGAAFSVAPPALKIRYHVENPTPHLVALFSRVPVVQPDQSVRLPSEGSYIETSGDRLIVRKNIVPPPRGMQAAETPLPCVVRVEPNGKFAEEFDLTFPVQVHQPFLQAIIGRDHPGMDVLPVTPGLVSSVTFELGAIAVFGATKLFPVPGHAGVFRVTPPIPRPPARRDFTASAHLNQPVPVLLYRAVERSQRQD
ncbi:MAG TPA: hypothetical protein VFL57_15585 [Bryobacteraceae bacterium]|nr:hypothetical protein [Bryobacteraceae bacterium]